MYQFIESLYYKNGEMPLLDWHEERFAGTQMAHFGTIDFPSLRTLIDLADKEHLQKNTVYKVRIVYALDDLQITFIPYQKKSIRKLQLIQNDTIQYAFKYLDRIQLEAIASQVPDKTEPIIARNGLLTDTTFSNIALYDGQDWFTPKQPLLEGVHCASLIAKGIVHPTDIPIESIYRYSKIRLVNAMVPWQDCWEFHTKYIQPL